MRREAWMMGDLTEMVKKSDMKKGKFFFSWQRKQAKKENRENEDPFGG